MTARKRVFGRSTAARTAPYTRPPQRTQQTAEMHTTKHYIPALLALFGACTLMAQTDLDKRLYIEQYAPLAIEQQERYNIPASITLAQGILESSSGKSRLAVEANNHFGIKCKNDWTGGRIYHDDDEAQECFRAYESAEESYTDHSIFLTTRPRYAKLFKLEVTDYKGWAHGLKEAGYATNPSYAQMLIKLIEDYSLYDFDTPEESEEMARDEAPSPKPRRERTPEETASIESMEFNPEALTAQPAANPAIPSGEGIDIDHYTVAIFSVGRFAVRMNNGCRYVVADKETSLVEIARAAGLSERRLRRINDMPSEGETTAGDIVYLERKKGAYTAASTHTAIQGETLRDVAQYYAIRLRKLQEMNRNTDATLNGGDEIRLCRTN